MPDNRIDKPRLDPPTLLINSRATWLSAHAQKISRHVSMVTAATCMRVWGTRPFSDLITRKLPSRIIEVPDNGGPDNRGSTVQAIYKPFLQALPNTVQVIYKLHPWNRAYLSFCERGTHVVNESGQVLLAISHHEEHVLQVPPHNHFSQFHNVLVSQTQQNAYLTHTAYRESWRRKGECWNTMHLETTNR